MIKELLFFVALLSCCCCMALPVEQQKTVIVFGQPAATKAEVLETAETGWRNGYGGHGYVGGWKRGSGYNSGGHRAGYMNYGGGWKRGGYNKLG